MRSARRLGLALGLSVLGVSSAFAVGTKPAAQVMPRVEYHLREIDQLAQHFEGVLREPCPHVDTRGLCHQLPESNYEDNVAEAAVTIPDHPGKTGTGPGTSDPTPNDSDLHDDNGDPID